MNRITFTWAMTQFLHSKFSEAILNIFQLDLTKSDKQSISLTLVTWVFKVGLAVEVESEDSS